MALKKSKRDGKKVIAVASLIITIFLLASVYLIGSIMNNKRENTLNDQFDQMYQDFNNMQILYLMSDTYDDQMACLAFESKIKELDKYIWDLGEKIDKYRKASEEFQTDQYYLTQKKIFNENEVYYLLLLRSMVTKCNISKQTVLFFYRNANDCRKCDDQSFILTDINIFDEENGDKDLAIFSFDMDTNITNLNILSEYYKIDKYPCVVINEIPYCGIQDENFIMDKICINQTDFDICRRYFNTQ